MDDVTTEQERGAGGDAEPLGTTVPDADSADDTVDRDRPELYPAETERRRISFDVDDEELVGPGGFPLRVQPAAAIAPGTTDAKRLLAIWFVRKSFYWMFFVALGIGTSVAIAQHQDAEVDVSNPTSLTGVWSLLLVALAVRFISGWIALAMALPLTFAHEPNLSPRENFGSSIGLFFDRLHVATAFRELRWTHHVRQVAQHRLGDTGRRLGKLDPILDVVNIVSGVAAFVAPVVVAGIVGS